MTTAIEQAKREMYAEINRANGLASVPHLRAMSVPIAAIEERLETYLEQLRQQYEEMASTAHQRFESIQSLEAANAELQMKNDAQRGIIEGAGGTNELSYQLMKMTESRDMFRNLHQAATHAAIESHGKSSEAPESSLKLLSLQTTDTDSGKTKIEACMGAIERWSDIQAAADRGALLDIIKILNGGQD